MIQNAFYGMGDLPEAILTVVYGMLDGPSKMSWLQANDLALWQANDPALKAAAAPPRAPQAPHPSNEPRPPLKFPAFPCPTPRQPKTPRDPIHALKRQLAAARRVERDARVQARYAAAAVDAVETAAEGGGVDVELIDVSDWEHEPRYQQALVEYKAGRRGRGGGVGVKVVATVAEGWVVACRVLAVVVAA